MQQSSSAPRHGGALRCCSRSARRASSTTRMYRCTNSPIHEATLRADNEAVLRLVSEKASLVATATAEGATPPHVASLNETSQHLAESLLKLGGPVDAVDAVGFAPLHRMVQFNRVYGATALLAYGAEVNQEIQGSSDTPLHLAARANFQEMAILLLAHGGNCNARNAAGEKPVDLGLEELWADS